MEFKNWIFISAEHKIWYTDVLRLYSVTTAWFDLLLQMVCDRSDVFASACAIARAFPIFTRRSSASRKAEKKQVTVELLVVGSDSSSLGAVETEVLLDQQYLEFPAVGYLFYKNIPTCFNLFISRLCTRK